MAGFWDSFNASQGGNRNFDLTNRIRTIRDFLGLLPFFTRFACLRWIRNGDAIQNTLTKSGFRRVLVLVDQPSSQETSDRGNSRQFEEEAISKLERLGHTGNFLQLAIGTCNGFQILFLYFFV